MPAQLGLLILFQVIGEAMVSVSGNRFPRPQVCRHE
jgi:hypothetical protein